MAEGTRDVVTIGSSAGGVEALPRLVHQLPKDLPAALFIIQHMSPTGRPYLVDILARSSPLPVSWAEQGERIRHGHVYVAPPDTHLLFTDDHVALNRGARENFSRPSIDKAFRSAAATHGSRTIGVLLTGMLDDGVAGLGAIRDAGGIVIVQDPVDAAFPELPARALQAVTPHHILPLANIAAMVESLTHEPTTRHHVPENIALEATLDQLNATPQDMDQLGRQTPIACPECSGPTWQIGDERQRRYRCYLGHAVTARELVAQCTVEVERALWSAVRALEERAMTLHTLGRDAEKSGNLQSASLYERQAKEAHEQAELARRFMRDVIDPK